MSKIEKTGAALRVLAEEVRQNVYAREAIAKALELIACAMSPCEGCEDCGSTQQAAVIDPADNPEAGADVGTVAAGVIATTEQALAGEQLEQGDNVNAGA